jgi:hypothetical protein
LLSLCWRRPLTIGQRSCSVVACATSGA